MLNSFNFLFRRVQFKRNKSTTLQALQHHVSATVIARALFNVRFPCAGRPLIIIVTMLKVFYNLQLE